MSSNNNTTPTFTFPVKIDDIQQLNEFTTKYTCTILIEFPDFPDELFTLWHAEASMGKSSLSLLEEIAKQSILLDHLSKKTILWWDSLSVEERVQTIRNINNPNGLKFSFFGS